MEKLKPGERERARESLPPPATVPPEVDLAAAARAIEAFLCALGHPPAGNPELAQTGQLVASAFHHELLAGHRVDPSSLLSDAIASDQSDLVVVRGIDVTCICPHHLLPASGHVHVGYAPAGKLAGLGALARLARCFAQRLILQETLCARVAETLVDQLGARAAFCAADLSPSCLTCRGERPAAARAVTLASAGQMREDSGLRREFLALSGLGPEPSP